MPKYLDPRVTPGAAHAARAAVPVASHGIMGAGIGNGYKAAKAACRVTTNGYGGNMFNEYWATGVE